MIFLDTSFFIGLVNPNDKFYERSNELLKSIQNGLFGDPFTSNYVMAETATLIAIRSHNNPVAIDSIRSLFIGDNIIATMIRIDEVLEQKAWDLFQKVNKSQMGQPISYVDCTNVIISQHLHIGSIISFDAHFEGWLKQIT